MSIFSGGWLRCIGRQRLLGILVALIVFGVVRPWSNQERSHTVPVTARDRAQIVQEIGRNETKYHFIKGVDGYQVTRSGYFVRFTDAGVNVGDDFSISMPDSDYMYPVVQDNRIEYDRGAVTEWYVNGPMGLEQGFTLQEPHAIELELFGASVVLSDDLRSATITTSGRTFTYTGLFAYDANGTELPTHLELNGSRLALVTDTAHAVFPVTVDPFIQEQKLTASDAANNDNFGYSVSITSDGSRVVIGAYADNSGQGSAYVFSRSGTVWSQEQKLTASDGASLDLFGRSVSITSDGDRIAIGANQDNSGQGSAYVFSRSGTVWSQEQKLTASDGAANDLFGYSVSITSDGSRVAISSHQDESSQGSVYVFSRSGTVWSQEQKLTASDGATNDQFGISVSITSDGDRIAIGAHQDNSGQGSAYVFSRSGVTWSQEQKLIDSDGVGGDRFGVSVSITSDGDRVAIGAHQDNSNQGSAYVFSRSGVTWTEEQKLTASDGAASDFFGISVSIISDGSHVVIGAYLSNSFKGSAYVFSRSGTVWSQEQKLTASDGELADIFGGSVSITSDDNRVVIGAYGDTSGQGSVYIYILDDTDPVLTPISIVSDNSDPTIAIPGDTVTLNFVSNEELASASVTFLSGGVPVTSLVSVSSTSDDELAWQAMYTTSATDTAGTVTFVITPEDSAGNDGTTYTTTTDATTVTFQIPATPTPTPHSSQSGSLLTPEQLAKLLGLPAPVRPTDFNLHEGDLISAYGSVGDPDVYIVNDAGYKRLFLNPVIFGFYGHLGGFPAVHHVTPTVRDAFVTSGLFRNCEIGDSRVYAIEVTADDLGILHPVDLTGEQAVEQDPNFFKKVFCINSNEFNWYPRSPISYTNLLQVPQYRRN